MTPCRTIWWGRDGARNKNRAFIPVQVQSIRIEAIVRWSPSSSPSAGSHGHLSCVEPPADARLCLINPPPPRRPAERAGARVLDRCSLPPSSARITSSVYLIGNHGRYSIRPSLYLFLPPATAACDLVYVEKWVVLALTASSTILVLFHILLLSSSYQKDAIS